ncbi:MAG: SCO family protein [Steroidobacteraceae bacterium]
MSKKRSVLIPVLLVLAAALAGYMVSRQLARTRLPELVSGTVLPAPRIVAPFALTDHLGQRFDNARLAGGPSLLFFGFTHCPDVCPTTLALMAQLQRDPSLQALRAVFVTVDPQRDDRAAMARYVGAFGERVTGLTGPEAALNPLLSNLGVARIVEARAGSDYSVDHSATLYYLNAQGALSAVFTPPLSFADLRTDLTQLLASGY